MCLFQIAFQSSPHLIGIGKRNCLHFIQCDEIAPGNQSLSALCLVIEHFGAAHDTTAGKPPISANISKKIRFASTLWSKLDQIQALFNKRKKSGKHSELFFFGFVSGGIIVNSSKDNINPFVCSEFFAGLFVVLKVNIVGTEIFEGSKLDFPSLEFLALDDFLSYSKVKSKSSGERYPSSTIPHISLPFTRSSLHESHTSLSMIVSLNPNRNLAEQKKPHRF